MDKYRKKLIEVALPLDAINKASAREKSIRHGHPSTLHLWWARRPLAACRAVLFASLVDDPDDDPMFAGDEDLAATKRAKLFDLIEELVEWKNSNNPRVINKARAEIARCVASGGKGEPYIFFGNWRRVGKDHYRLSARGPHPDGYPAFLACQRKCTAPLFCPSMGEQFEFLLTVGCLHWKTPSGSRVKRHMLVLPVTVNFDSVNAVVAVRSAATTAQAEFEIDMLAMQDRAPADIEEGVQNSCSDLGDNLFQDQSKTLVKAYVQSLDSEGMFVDTLERVSGEVPPKPRAHFAPALVIRHRTTKTLIAAYNKIIAQLQEAPSGTVPPVVRKIAGELGVDNGPSEEAGDPPCADDRRDDEVYFPLPSNDEQRRILNALSRQAGVLVQGPPGTGKSQTIANLICHLLASGKRILVTSQKTPALRVLKKKLPAEVADLCMMILGEGTDEQLELRRSVSKVVDRHANTPLVQSHERIDKLRRALDKARQDKAQAFETLCALREVETFRHPARFGKYGPSEKIWHVDMAEIT